MSELVYSKREDGTYVFFFTAESYFAFEDCDMSLAENHLMSSTDPVIILCHFAIDCFR